MEKDAQGAKKTPHVLFGSIIHHVLHTYEQSHLGRLGNRYRFSLSRKGNRRRWHLGFLKKSSLHCSQLAGQINSKQEDLKVISKQLKLIQSKVYRSLSVGDQRNIREFFNLKYSLISHLGKMSGRQKASIQKKKKLLADYQSRFSEGMMMISEIQNELGRIQELLTIVPNHQLYGCFSSSYVLRI